MIIDKATYRANDIRGIADEKHPNFQLSDDFCTLTALAYVELLRKNRGKEPQELKVVVGKDVRRSSSRLKKSFIDALINSGIHVIDITPSEKVSSTPMVYFSTWLFDADGGVEVTGSHLDKEWNGFKLCIGSESTTENHIREMFQTAKRFEEEFLKMDLLPSVGINGKGKGELEEADVLKDYHDMIVANVVLRDRWEELALKALSRKICLRDAISIAMQEVEKLKEERRKPLSGIRVVYDAGNGTTGITAPQILRNLGADVIELYCEPDGNFPHHLPDPTIPRFLEDLRVEVLHKNAHIGLSSDADGDRAGAVSPSGRMIIGEQILALLCRKILKERSHAKIVYDTKCSDAIKEIIIESGGVPIECKTGFSFIKAKMREIGAVAGGEMSGHVYFEKNNRADDAVFAFSELLLLVAEELSHKKDTNVVDELLKDFLRYVNTPEIRIGVVSDEEKNRVCDAVERYYRELTENQPEKYRRRIDEGGNDIDGVKIDFLEESGWALVRRSNTSPAIILRMEARNEEGLRKIEEHVLKKFREFKNVDLNADDYMRKILWRVRC